MPTTICLTVIDEIIKFPPRVGAFSQMSYLFQLFFFTSKNTCEVYKKHCQWKFYQSAKLLLNMSAILIHTYRTTSNASGKINKTPVKVPTVLDLLLFLAFKNMMEYQRSIN